MRSPTRWLAATAPLIIASFVAAHVLTVRAAQNLHVRARSIQNRLAHSQLLSAVRGEVHLLGMATGRALWEAEAGEPFDRAVLDENRRTIAEQLDRLRGLTSTAEELAQERELERAIDEAERAIDRTVALLDAGDLRGARAVVSLALVRRADQTLERLIDLDGEEARLESARVADTERRIERLAPLLDAVAAAIALALTALAVLAVRQFARLADERNRLAERRAEELELFAGRVAHDLKNPLGAIALRLVVARRYFESDDAAREELGKLSRGVARMNQIVEGLFDFARAGGRPEANGRAELAAVLDELLVDFVPDAERAGAELIVEPFRPVAVACPPGPLASVLGNLLRNAIKYIVEARGERRIRVRAREHDGRVRVEVEDTGPGVPPGMERAVFEPFVRSGSRAQPGIGLGLATVKRLVEGYRGEVGLESRAGAGSCFWFELPIAAPVEQALALH
ncbi:MAG TPA: HAMP domain-containing sensor histidine kinase [Polyangia bacterium]|nr:HAMP domain-containing sensor histidine kinase [Polyangia bacterium]